jgi:hypothetical protein
MKFISFDTMDRIAYGNQEKRSEPRFLRACSTPGLPQPPVLAFAASPLLEVAALGDARFHDEIYIDER